MDCPGMKPKRCNGYNSVLKIIIKLFLKVYTALIIILASKNFLIFSILENRLQNTTKYTNQLNALLLFIETR